MKTLFVPILVGLGLAPPLPAQWTAPPSDSLQRLLADRVERRGSTGILLGVLENGRSRVVTVGRRGGPGTPTLDSNTVFEIGSVSKVLTNTLLGEMVARGEVALDDPIQKYLPDSVPAPGRNGKPITLLDLATQSSGLPRLPLNFDATDTKNPYAHYDARKLYAFLSGYTLTRDPGARYEYSNLGMGLLGHLLARRLGMSYERAVTERVLRPLGMTDTRVELSPALSERLAQGHDGDLEPAPNWDFDVLAGAGGWRSTAADMLRFLRAQLSPPAGPLGQGIALATEPRRPTASSGMRIGLGWHVLERGDDRIVWHNGQTAGYHSFVGFRPSTGANVLLLSNSATDIDDIGLHVLDPALALRPPAPPRSVAAVSVDLLRELVGRYELAPTFAIEISLDGDHLVAQPTNQPPVRLYPASASRFFLKQIPAEIGFTRDSTGAVTGLVLYQNGRETPGRRVGKGGE